MYGNWLFIYWWTNANFMDAIWRIILRRIYGYDYHLISLFIQTGNVQGLIIWLSIPIVITIGLINMANNIRDRVKDKASGRKTLPILLGKRASVIFMAIMYIVAYALVVFTALFKSGGSLFYLLVLLSFPMPIKAVRRFNKMIHLQQ